MRYHSGEFVHSLRMAHRARRCPSAFLAVLQRARGARRIPRRPSRSALLNGPGVAPSAICSVAVLVTAHQHLRCTRRTAPPALVEVLTGTDASKRLDLSATTTCYPDRRASRKAKT
jgi:hypothetical protein